MRQFVSNTIERINNNTNESEPYLFRLGVILIIAYFGFYFFNFTYANPEGYENLGLRIAISSLGLICIFHNKLPLFLRKHFAILFHFIICFSFPFFFSFMLFMNQDSNIWQVNGLVGFVLLSFFVDWVSFLMLSFIGITTAYILSIMIDHHIIFNRNLAAIFLSYNAPVIYFLIFSQKRDSLQMIKKQYQAHIEEWNLSLKNKVEVRTEELNKALSVKTEFLNNISHEIRAPVAGFSMAADNLMSLWPELNEAQKFEMVKVICSSAERIKNLSMHLIDATKLQSGTNILNQHRVNLTNLIHDFIDEAESLYIKEKNIKIKFKCNKDFYVNVDDQAMCQVLRNIVTNAIKFSLVNSEIHINLESDKENIKVTIRDEGIGIPNNELDQIFTPFYQSSRTKTGAGGVGLGLNISKQIVEAHGGKIWAINNSNRGASFIFILPLAKNRTKPKKNNKKKRILVIDDDQLIHSSLTLGLSALGHKITSAMDGKERLDILEQNCNQIDVVVLDIMMPGMDGIQVLEIIKAKWPKLKVILHSGVASVEEIEKTKQLGASSFIQKPYKTSELINHLNG